MKTKIMKPIMSGNVEHRRFATLDLGVVFVQRFPWYLTRLKKRFALFSIRGDTAHSRRRSSPRENE